MIQNGLILTKFKSKIFSSYEKSYDEFLFECVERTYYR